MASDSKIALLKEAVLKLKADGVQHLSVEVLLNYVTKLEGVPERRDLPASGLEHYKAQLAAWLEKQKEVSALNVEGFKSVILAGQARAPSGRQSY